jgi:hypothetical protein
MVDWSSARNHFHSRSHPRRCKVDIPAPPFSPCLSRGIHRDRSIPRDAPDQDRAGCTSTREIPRGVHTTDSEVGSREVRVSSFQNFQFHDTLNSDKTLQGLAKHMHSQLLPSDIDEEDEDSEGSHVGDQLPLCCLEFAINHVAVRVNYGAENIPNQTKVPAHLCVWRWEVDERNFHWLPKAVRDKLKNRLHERRQVFPFSPRRDTGTECIIR